MPLLRESGSIQRKTLFWHFPHYWWGGRLTPYSIIREGDWKLIRHYEDGRRELFHIENDLGEQNNLAAEMPDKVRDLDDKLTSWLQSVGAKLPQTNPEFTDNSLSP